MFLKTQLSILLKGSLVIFFASSSILAFAQDSKISLSTATEDSTFIIKATVTAGDSAMKEVGVKFFAQRTFKPLPLGGTATTDENGVATLTFPVDLPGDSGGNVQVIAQLEDDDAIESQISVPWGKKVSHFTERNERALWASRPKAPWYLILAANTIIAGVWGTMLYIVFLIFFRLKKAGKGYNP